MKKEEKLPLSLSYSNFKKYMSMYLKNITSRWLTHLPVIKRTLSAGGLLPRICQEEVLTTTDPDM